MVPNYTKYIKEPMCYKDIIRNVKKGKYDGYVSEDGRRWGEGLRRDFLLVYGNCREFNKKGGKEFVEFANR